MATETVCPACGRADPLGSVFCGGCGARLGARCPTCGASNPPDFRFCGACGAPLEPAARVARAAEERKVVTVLFADLTASTEMAARLDPEDLRAVLRPFFDAMANEIDRFGGTLEKFIGDAIVAVFGAPVGHEDDPERAVRAAIAMQSKLGELNQQLADVAGGDLAMRIGVNTGEVIAHVGVHGADHALVTGEAVNVAARFQTLASAGSVVVGERTHLGTKGAFSYRALGDVEVKGIDRALPAWEVVGAQPAEPRSEPRGLRAPLVGRHHELELLHLVLARTEGEAHANLVTIVGPAGIGKSRLAYEFTSALAGRDPAVRVVRGRCLPYGDGLTFWPLAEILKTDAGILDSDAPEAVLEKSRARLDPVFGAETGTGTASVLLSSVGVAVGPDPLAGMEPESASRAIARAWRIYLESMAAERPIIAVIEDIHWADAGLLDLLELLAARTAAPVLLLCLARPDLVDRRPAWGGGLPNAATVALTPLSSEEGGELLGGLLGGSPPAEIVGPVTERSEGNPFFAGELLRMMIEDGTLERREGSWSLTRPLPSHLPDSVQGVIVARLDMLPAVEKRTIQAAAVIGRVFWQRGVELLGEERAADALEALIDKGLVWERETSSLEGERELIFDHLLTRDVAYAGIPRARRTAAHAAVGAWVEQGTRGREEEFSEILAYHFERGGGSREDLSVRVARGTPPSTRVRGRGSHPLVRPGARVDGGHRRRSSSATHRRGGPEPRGGV